MIVVAIFLIAAAINDLMNKFLREYLSGSVNRHCWLIAVAKDMGADAAVLHPWSSQVPRWKASDQGHAAIRTAGGAAQGFIAFQDQEGDRKVRR